MRSPAKVLASFPSEDTHRLENVVVSVGGKQKTQHNPSLFLQINPQSLETPAPPSSLYLDLLRASSSSVWVWCDSGWKSHTSSVPASNLTFSPQRLHKAVSPPLLLHHLLWISHLTHFLFGIHSRLSHFSLVSLGFDWLRFLGVNSSSPTLKSYIEPEHCKNFMCFFFSAHEANSCTGAWKLGILGNVVKSIFKKDLELKYCTYFCKLLQHDVKIHLKKNSSFVNSQICCWASFIFIQHTKRL